MNWNWEIVGVFAVFYVPTIGFAINGLIQLLTSKDERKKNKGLLKFSFGLVGTAIVTILMLLALANDEGDEPSPSEPIESVSESIHTEIIPSSDDSNFRRNMVCTGGTYTGYVDQESGQPDGKGTMVYTDGNKYNGEWKNGQCHGDGEMIYANGDTYDGQWQNGVKSGYGVYTWSNGQVYKGDYKNDLRDGEGEYIGWTGFITDQGGWKGNYYGTSAGDVFEGSGKFEFDNGDRFVGTFHNNEFWVGMYTYRDGTQRKIDMGPID